MVMEHKRDKLLEQLDETKLLWANIEKRTQTVFNQVCILITYIGMRCKDFYFIMQPNLIYIYNNELIKNKTCFLVEIG